MNFIDCEFCEDWKQEKKIKESCPCCAGRGKIQNPEEHLCNNCGSRMHPPKSDPNWQFPNGLSRAKVVGDYSSTHLTDDVIYRFSICEFCLRLMFNNFVIPPALSDNRADAIEFDYKLDKTNYEYEQWRQSGGFSQAYKNRKCNAVKDCINSAIYTILHGSDTFDEKCACEEHVSEYRNYKWYKIVPFIPDTLKAFV
jgi:hypothetical protein